MPKRIDIAAVPVARGASYPAPYAVPCAARERQRLGDAAGLTDFGVNLLRLAPGVWSSQRHWHAAEDEFVYVLSGEVVLVTDAGEELLRAGDCAGFPAGVPDGHHLQNRSDAEAVVLEVGSRRPEEDEGDYPDIDLRFLKGRAGYAHKDGRPYRSTDWLAQNFIDLRLPKAEWTHEAHLRVGLWHALRHGDPETLDLLRERIRRYNAATGGENTATAGYHETITRFYVGVIRDFVRSADVARTVDELAVELIERYGDRALPLRYYSRERLFSTEARLGWVEPDLVPSSGS